MAYPRAKVAHGQLTVAQVNANSRAGTMIVPKATGRTITVTDCWMRAIGGAAATATAVILTDTASSPVTAVSNAVAGLPQNTVLRAGAANSTATNLGTALTVNEGLQIGCTVQNLGTATHLDYMVEYTVT